MGSARLVIHAVRRVGRMKHHPPISALAVMLLIGCYIGWAFVTGAVSLRGRVEPIRRRDNPREYWYYMKIITVLYVLAVALVFWVFS